MQNTASDAVVNQWARGADAYSQWMIALLDMQSAWSRDMELRTLNLMAPWVAWSAWGQAWLDALRHDLATRAPGRS